MRREYFLDSTVVRRIEALFAALSYERAYRSRSIRNSQLEIHNVFLRLPLYRNNAIIEIARRLNRRFSSATIIVFRRCESKISKRIKAPEVDIVVARAHRDVLFSTAAQLSCEFLGNTYSFRQLRFDFGYIRPFCHASIRIGIKIVIAETG